MPQLSIIPPRSFRHPWSIIITSISLISSRSYLGSFSISQASSRTTATGNKLAINNIEHTRANPALQMRNHVKTKPWLRIRTPKVSFQLAGDRARRTVSLMSLDSCRSQAPQHARASRAVFTNWWGNQRSLSSKFDGFQPHRSGPGESLAHANIHGICKCIVGGSLRPALSSEVKV